MGIPGAQTFIASLGDANDLTDPVTKFLIDDVFQNGPDLAVFGRFEYRDKNTGNLHDVPFGYNFHIDPATNKIDFIHFYEDAYAYSIASRNGGSWTANLSPTETVNFIFGKVEDDYIQAQEGIANQIYGYQGNDRIYGGRGDDVIYGGSGQDLIRGGLGNNLLYGNEDADVFVLALEDGISTIGDFVLGEDKLGLAGGLIFSELSLVQVDGNTEIRVTGTNQLLATIQNVPVNAMSANDFVDVFDSAVSRLDGGINGEVFAVRAANNENIVLQFYWNQRVADFNNEVGVFVVEDEQGRVRDPNTGLLVAPGEANYASLALSSPSRQIVFTSGEGEGDLRQLTFTGNERLAFYLVQNNTTEAFLANPEQNQVFFSNPQGNPGNFDHLRSQIANGLLQLNFEDGLLGGDQDFRDVAISVREAVLRVPGPIGAAIQTDFTISREAEYNNTVGFYKIDDLTGGIDLNGDGIINIRPGEAGYVETALQRSLSILPTPENNSSVSTQETLTGGDLLSFFLVADGTVEQALNSLGETRPFVYFSFDAASSDGISHMRPLGGNLLGFEDLFGGGDRDFDDAVIQIDFRPPVVV